jgi:acetylornithine/N-succinyldiaminopimelate aminotransferase
MTLAKGLGSGFPVGACVATRCAASGMTAGSHASTFGGNPLAMSVVSAVLAEVLGPGFLDRVARVGVRLEAGLDRLVAARPEVFQERRGVGLMQGLRCHATPARMAAALRERGLLVAPAHDNVIRLLPPLIACEAEVDEALEILDTV